MSAPDRGPLKVALLGCGTVGSAVLSLISEQADDLTARIGRPVEVAGVAVRRPAHHPDVPAHLLTTDAQGLVTREDVDLVVEVIGGIEPARTLLLAAFAAGKSVVSANKALLADDGVALHAAAADAGVDAPSPAPSQPAPEHPVGAGSGSLRVDGRAGP